MTEWFELHHSSLRLGIFLAVFFIMAAWEMYSPSRKLLISKGWRWLNNIALILLSSTLIKWLTPFALTGLALVAQQQQIGLFVVLDLPLGLSVIFSLFIMDGLIYGQHRLMHRVPFLWRLHRLHHSDLDFDVTTAVRFHPIEMLFSLFIKAAIVLALGVPLIAVVIFELLLSSLALFNHANINLPKTLEKMVRLVVVTPDIHRIHHSEIKAETNSNYGFNLIIWDKLFGSYKAQASNSDSQIDIGLVEFKDKKEVSSLPYLLIQPLK